MKIAFVSGVQQALEDAGLLKYSSFDRRLVHAHAAVKIAMGNPEGDQPIEDSPYGEDDLQDLVSVLLQMQETEGEGPPVAPGSTSTHDSEQALDADTGGETDENKPDQALELGEEVLDEQDKEAGVGGLFSGVAKRVGKYLPGGKTLRNAGIGLSGLGAASYVGGKSKQHTMKTQAPISHEISRAERKLRGY